MSTTPYSFIKRGNLFIIPVGPSIAEVDYPTYTLEKPRDYSQWVHGKVDQPPFDLDKARMPPSLYQDVRDDLVRFSPVAVSRSAFRKSNHAYVGVIDSNGKPYYFALDSRGISVKPAAVDDDKVWKTFDRLSEDEQTMAVRERRANAAKEMVVVDRELSDPKLVLLIKALPKKANDGEVKKTPTKKASKKQVGAGGKPRYTYPNEKKGAAKPGANRQVPLVVVNHDDSKHADPNELANQLGVSVRTLRRIAKKLGREEFSRFMRSRLKRFAAKHRVDPDYWGTLYGQLAATEVKAEPDSV